MQPTYLHYNVLLEPTDYVGRKGSLLISGVLVVTGGSLQSASFASWYVQCVYYCKIRVT